jgi:hypothetical protein
MIGKKILRKIRLLFKAVFLRISPLSIKRLIKSAFYHLKYRAISDKNKIIWIEVNKIEKAIANEREDIWTFSRIMDGDWDVKTREVISKKVLGIEQHFSGGIPWKETILFKNYEERFKTELLILRCKSIEELEKKYETEISSLFEKIKKEGFLIPTKNNPSIDVIYVYIDRNGNFLFGGNGNHRLAFARILGINKIPVKIRARHKEWQEIREEIYKMDKKNIQEVQRKYKDFIEHPDLLDILS